VFRQGRVVDGDVTLDGAAHEHQASAGTVVLVLEHEVRGTGLQAEAAVHAEVQSGPGVA
jgi:hypothetical protein